MKTSLIAILLSFATSGCAFGLKTYKTSTEIESGKLIVHTVFTDKTNEECQKRNIKGNMILGCSVSFINRCVVVTQRPDDENDKLRNTVLGHELMHCYGARHE